MKVDDSFWSQVVKYNKHIGEKNSCTVVSLAVVTGQPLDKCYKFMSKFGRKIGIGMSTEQLQNAFNSMSNYKFVYRKFENGMSLRTFCAMYPTGTYFLCVRGHALSMVDGVVYDHTEKPRRKVKHAWRVYKIKNKT